MHREIEVEPYIHSVESRVELVVPWEVHSKRIKYFIMEWIEWPYDDLQPGPYLYYCTNDHTARKTHVGMHWGLDNSAEIDRRIKYIEKHNRFISSGFIVRTEHQDIMFSMYKNFKPIMYKNLVQLIESRKIEPLKRLR